MNQETMWERMTRQQAKKLAAEWQALSAEEYQELKAGFPQQIAQSVPERYMILREAVLNANNTILRELDSDPRYQARRDYFRDLKLGMALYRILQEYGFSSRVASYDPVWIYLSMQVLPDLIADRWKPGPGQNVNEDRLFRRPRRIYLKAVWWYVYLSLQETPDGSPDYERTYQILEENTTDEIEQLVARAGEAGYRTDLYRTLMARYDARRREHEQACARGEERKGAYGADFFRKVMLLNTARSRVFEPALCVGGIEGYVRGLFRYFDEE